MAKKTIMDLAEESTNYTRTENNGLTHKSTLNHVLDFFSLGGALRERSVDDIRSLFSKAYAQDPLLALKCLFYLRDVRGGQGERRTFRTLLTHIGNSDPESIIKNFLNIVEFGRWDDFYAFINTSVEKDAFEFMRKQFVEDLNSQTPSLLAKWLQSNNRKSSEEHRIRYKKTLKYFNMRADQYRKKLSFLRAKIKIVESQMCAKKWNEINYEHVPSQASRRYAKAFKKNDESRYIAYLESVKKGEKKIKAHAVYPYEIIRSAVKDPSSVATFDAQWNAMPNWVGNENSIVVADVSGSMSSNDSLPLLCSVSLAMYCAERNKGIFHNKFMTFSKNPTIETIHGRNILEKWNCLTSILLAENTDLLKVFLLLLHTAKENHLPQSEMPSKIYIVSDMEFDEAQRESNFGWSSVNTSDEKTIFKTAQEYYTKYGYTLPKVVFWNVNARHDMAPVVKDECGVYLVSGCSPSIFKALMATQTLTPIDLMMEVLNSKRYENIKI